jgi:cytochrome P450
MDGQEHKDHRRLVSDWFRPKNLAALQVRLDALAEASVQKMSEADGRCDFALNIAMQYPLNVILSLLGLPESDYPRMLKLTQEIFGPEDPEQARDNTALASMMETITDFVAYFSALSLDRQAVPTEDLATVIANGDIDGQPIGPMEQIGHYVLIATAGHDTTSSAISGGTPCSHRTPGAAEAASRRPIAARFRCRRNHSLDIAGETLRANRN